MRFLLVLSVVAGLGFALMPSSGSACLRAPQPSLPTAPLSIETLRGTYEFTVELATTDEQKACGLMRRPRLGRAEGMLFRNRPAGPSYFWMKNTPQPLDMLFIGPKGAVVHIAEHTTPYSTNAYGTDRKVAAVLEVKAGTASRLAIELGDPVRHSWFERD